MMNYFFYDSEKVCFGSNVFPSDETFKVLVPYPNRSTMIPLAADDD